MDRIYKVLREDNSFSTFELPYKLLKNCVLKCLTDVVVFSFNRESLTYAKRMAAQTKRKVLLETISRLDFFEPLDFEQKDKLIDILEERDFVSGDDVQMHSVPFLSFFILYEGKVGVVNSAIPGLDNFSSKKFKTLQNGDFIGEKALFSNLEISNEQFIVQSEFATVFCLKKQRLKILLDLCLKSCG